MGSDEDAKAEGDGSEGAPPPPAAAARPAVSSAAAAEAWSSFYAKVGAGPTVQKVRLLTGVERHGLKGICRPPG